MLYLGSFFFFFLPIVALQIRYDWVRDLLPRLHEVDSYSLSGWAEGNLTDSCHEGNSRDLDQHQTGLFIPVASVYRVQLQMFCFRLEEQLLRILFQILPLKLLKFQSETQKTLLRLPGNALWREKEHVTKSRTRDWSNNPEKVKRFYKDRQHVDSAMPKGTCSKQISRHHVHQVQCKRCCYLLHEWGHTTKTLMNSLTEAHIHCSKSYVDFGP